MQPCASPPPITDEALVERIRTGDRAAESLLVERYSRGVMNLVRRSAPECADDVHQDTFRAILERLRTRGIEEPAKLDRFILRTAKNILRSTQRDSARRPLVALADLAVEPEDRDPGPPEQLSTAQLVKHVRQVIAEMHTDRDRQILYLFYIAGVDKAQICARLALDSVHFNRVLFRARERFRQLLLAGNRFDPADRA